VTSVRDLLRKVELLRGEESREGGASDADIDHDVLFADLRRIVEA